MNAITGLPANGSIPYEVFWKPLLNDPKLNALPFTLHAGKIGKELYFDSEFGAEPSIKASCGWTYSTGTSITKKSLDPVEVELSFKQCYTDFVKSVWGDSLPDGIKKGELTPELVDRIVQKQMNSLNTSFLFLTFLGDKGATNPFIAGIDGLYAKLAAGAAANDGTVDAGALTDTDINLTNIEATMFAIYTAQSDLMKTFDNSQKAFIVTQSVYEAYVRFLQVGNGTAFLLQNADAIKNGVSGVTYNGVPVINASWVDRGLKLYDVTGSPASVNNPHRIVLTVPTNHHVMIDGTGFETSEPFYDRKDDLVYFPMSAMVDYQYGYGDLNVIAGF
jgi:hypothetical protein